MYRPSTLDNLKNIEEVTDVWLARHGSLFLKRIVEFCANNGDVAMDIPPVVTKPAEEKLVYSIPLACAYSVMWPVHLDHL